MAVQTDKVKWEFTLRPYQGDNEATGTAITREVLDAGVKEFLLGIDAYRSPFVSQQPCQRTDGMWTAKISWYRMD